MKQNPKSSITLPIDDLRLVQKLKTQLRLKSNVEVVRAGLRLLKERTDRGELREAYRQASRATRRTNAAEAKEPEEEFLRLQRKMARRGRKTGTLSEKEVARIVFEDR